MQTITVLIVIATFLLLYFLPAGIAYCRNHRNFAAILGLNALGGWTGLGWLVAFVWSLTANTKQDIKISTQRINMDEGPLE